MAELESLPHEVACVHRPATAGEVDEQAYLAANPDVARTGQSARAHFAAAGHAEGRLQLANTDAVTRLRRHKLSRVRWRADRPPVAAEQERLNFIAPEMQAEFGIPDDVPVSAHPYGGPMLEVIRSAPDGLFLDVGAGLRQTYHANVVNTDIYPSPSTDVLCVGEDLPFASDQFDAVFCFAVLEHTMRPWDVAREICRVLKPGGKVFVDWPFLQPVHGYPHHYYNATPRGNEALFEPYCDVEPASFDHHHHPLIGARWMLTGWRNGLPDGIAQQFEAKTVGELIATDPDAALDQDWCAQLHPFLWKAVPSGSRIVGIKRPMFIHPTPAPGAELARLEAENVALQQALLEMQQSTSWWLTAPLRSVVGWLRGKPAAPAPDAGAGHV